jgi:hypothetical protein
MDTMNSQKWKSSDYNDNTKMINSTTSQKSTTLISSPRPMTQLSYKSYQNIYNNFNYNIEPLEVTPQHNNTIDKVLLVKRIKF